MFRTQLTFKYSLSIFPTSGNRAVNGEQISVTTFSGVNEYLICSNAAAFNSAISSPTMNSVSTSSQQPYRESREMKRPTMTKLIHALGTRLGNIVTHNARSEPKGG